MIPRCTATERAVFVGARPGYMRYDRSYQHGEPALGTLDERLDIVLRRLGATTRIVLTRAERAQLEACRLP